ncbi:MAG: MotA/TolQ/ExbB proton channel family protein [Candidatus Omnitrophota bacterium]|nr:MotA/TolQ/ExbB proton channel family protein [Candidatus Omnitrophota bacterium]
MFLNKRFFLMILMAVFISAVVISTGFCAEKVEKYIPDIEAAEEGMTLWQIIRAGGEVMVVLAFLSIAALALITYYFLTIKQEKLLPEDFLEKSLDLIEQQRFEEARRGCEDSSSSLISKVLFVGLSRLGKEKVVVKEAIQDEGRRATDGLWQKLSYLADVAAISPMVGLLGTVLGMIQAFNVIAFQAGAVKPILLASGISKAMVTTATGLIIAIPAMIFYSFFRGRLQDVSARLENISQEIYHLITEKGA